MKFGKWLAGGLGWVVLGPIGALAGFALGSVFDKLDPDNATGPDGNTHSGDFMVSLLVLSAAVMKADGKVVRSELDFVKRFFTANFGEEKTKEAILMLREILLKKIPTEEVCYQIRDNMDYAARLQLLHFLFGISGADGNFASSEVLTIEYIAHHLRILQADTNSIKVMFLHGNGSEQSNSGGQQHSYNSLNNAYTVLEISTKATDDEVKKAYREMARKYHPDKVSYLGEDVVKGAKEKFQKVTEAYDKIKSARGMN